MRIALRYVSNALWCVTAAILPWAQIIMAGVVVSGSSTSSNSSSDLSESSTKQVIIVKTATKRGSSYESKYAPSTSSPTEEVHEEIAVVKEYFCGIGKCRPKWMQVFRNGKCFTFILCLYCCIEGALVSGFTSVVLSSIERRYRFSSVWAGLIASTFDMAVLLSVLVISYFGGRGHKPRWLGVSLIIQGIGALVFSLPQFVFGPYRETQIDKQFELCDSDSHRAADCSSANSFPLAFFFVGNILIGIGAAPLFTVGTAYLDDIIHPKYVSIHLGIFYAFSVIGPSLGYGVGGAFLSIYVDPWMETSLQPSDPSWVGAWWLCFLVAAVISWLFAIPFLLFPKLLPDSLAVKKAREKEMAQVYKGKDGVLDEVDLATKVKTFPKHLKQVLKTPSWFFITTAICFSTLIVAGVASFAPKYLESQFGLTASRASLLVGAVAIPSGGAGVFVGGLLVYFTKAKGRRAALINWIITLLALGPTFIFIVHCPTVELVGVTLPYTNGSVVESSTSRLNGSCFSSCGCNSSLYEPVCGQDKYTYFSPCTAGCQQKSDNTSGSVFENCSCIAERLQNDYEIFNMTAKDGPCDQGCNKLWYFLTIMGLDLFLLFVLQVPNIIITVRSVADEQRTLALGAQSVAFRTLGSIPGPIVFGTIFDSACIYWQFECSRRGNCWAYNNLHLSQRALSLAMLGIGTNFIFSLLSWIVYPKKNEADKLLQVRLSELKPVESDKRSFHESTESSDSRESPVGIPSVIRLDSHSSGDGLLD